MAYRGPSAAPARRGIIPICANVTRSTLIILCVSENIEDSSAPQTPAAQPGQVSPEDVHRQWVNVQMADDTTTGVRIFTPPAPGFEPKAEAGESAQPTSASGSQAAGQGSGVSPSEADTEPRTAAETGHDGKKPLVILWPGFGVGARYYEPIAKELASRGWIIAIGELHGQGLSTAKASRQQDWGYHDMASSDFPRTIRAVKRRLELGEKYPTVMLTHSMGGQMASVFMSRPEARELNVLGFMGVGTGTPYYKGFEGRTRFELHIGSLLMSSIVLACGYQPEGALDLGNYGRQARRHILEWTKFAQLNSLKNLHGQDMDYVEAMAKTQTNILLTRFGNDADCTVASAQYLGRLFPEGSVSVEEYPPELEQLGHNRWARKPQIVADRFECWVANVEY